MYYVSQARFYLRGDCGMISPLLTKLMTGASKIPANELRKGAREEDRPTEMALLEEIIPKDKILEIRNKAGYWISRGCVTTTKIVFQVNNGTTHRVVLSSDGGKITVTDNGEVLPIKTIKGLRGHILKHAGVE